MADTSSRMLALLNLLQTNRHWAGGELADRLGVTPRTLRRDIDRLRELGYRISAAPGVAGGYQLEAGSQLPPLLLTDSEAVTTAIGLRLVTGHAMADGELTALGALAKFEQVLPARLRRRVDAISAHLRPGSPVGAAVPVELIGQLALACRDGERVRFSYTAGDGQVSSRHVEPHAIVASHRRWFLLGWDLVRSDWRTFRADRLGGLVGTGVRFAARELPGGVSPAEYIAASLSELGREGFAAEVELELGIEEVRRQFGRWAEEIADLGGNRTRWIIRSSHLPELAGALAWIPEGVAYTVSAEPGVMAYLTRHHRRLGAALAIMPRQ